MAVVTPASNKPEPREVRTVYPEVDLNPQQKRQWSETLAAVNWIAPGFTHLLYTMLNQRGDSQVACFTEALPQGCTAATDGSQILLKPTEFFKHPLMERVFIVNHEISHCVGDHCGMGYVMRKRGEVFFGNKKLPYDDMQANVFQDYVINDMLIEAQFGTYNKSWLHDKKIATYTDDWVEVYFKHYKKRPPPKGPGNNPGQGDGSGVTPPGKGQFDQHLDPGSTQGKTPEDTGPRDVQAWQQAVAGALAVARAQGKSPASFEMFFGPMLEPKVEWTEHIRGLVARKIGSGGYDFRRPDRRLIVRDIISPGRSGHGAGVVVIAFDTSGSIFGDPTLIDRFKAETMGIFQDVRPKEIKLLECDAKMQRVTEMTDAGDMASIQVVKGGGGTSFVPVFEWIEEQDLTPDCLLYLTDGDGDFPKEAPRYAVIWGDISGDKTKYKFGDVVEIPTTE